MDLRNALFKLFWPKDNANINYVTISASRINNGYELTIGQEYNAPACGFKQLKQLAEMFGTDEIDVDNYAHSGCETCDYGSEYGHTIQIYSPVLLCDELELLCKVS